ncbi:MAG: DUF362 domain-containing protein, partial [Promethearchaeota archaeon]
TPEDAQIAQYLEIRPLPVKEISKRSGKSEAEIKKILEDMADKGIIHDIPLGRNYSHFLIMAHLLNVPFKISGKGGRSLAIREKAAKLHEQFFIKEKYYKRYETSDAGTPIFRVIPIDKSIEHATEILNAEEIHRLFDNCMEPIVATDCPCRQRTEILGNRECKGKFPIKETCFQTGAFGQYFLRRGEGIKLSREEAHQAVDKFAKLGLVFTTDNTKQNNHMVICSCCECCCSILRGITRFRDKNESAVSKSNYISEVNQDLCKGCGLCMERCPFGAITIENEKSIINTKKCYGCGVCAVTCPTGAIKLHRSEPERSHIYKNVMDLMGTISRENRK